MNNFVNIFRDNPIFSGLSINVVSFDEVSLSLCVSDVATKKNDYNVLDGSFALSFFDTAVGFFIANKNNALRAATIFSYSMNIFLPLKGDSFLIEISQLSSGGTICVFQVDWYVMRDEGKVLLASGQVHAYVSLKKSKI
jgi:acyl-coenzyme A thioesterase PaaI-like protein